MHVTIKRVIILVLTVLITSFAQGKGDNAVSLANLDEKQLVELSLPDPFELRQRSTFRGPYTDQDDPVLKRAQQKEAARTGVDRSKFVCRPPACFREAGSLIVKLATPTQSAQLSKSLGSAAQHSALLDSNSMTPIFQQKLVTNAVAKYRAVSAKQKGGSTVMPTNSLGKPVDLSRWRRLELPKGADLDEAIKELSLDPRVEVVESNFERRLLGEESREKSSSPIQTLNIAADDPRKNEQWALTRTRTEDAWQWLDENGYPAWGDRNIVVAVIDSGVDYTHEDLAGNMWINAGEIPDNGVDDDNNGFIDDVYGADVVGSIYDHDGDPQDDNGHGTHVAGIIAAQGNNNIGIIGVAPNSQIMAIKAAQYSGRLTATDISEGILYAYQQGADIINMSFGGGGRSILTEEALAVAFSNAVLIAAAGNQGDYNDFNCGPNARPSYPAAYPYVLGVMAEAPTVNARGDWLAGFSNWDCSPKNAIEYEVMAPGVDILSTIPGDAYAAWDGTSMAAPVVAGMAALVRTRFDDKSIYSSRFVMGQLASTGSTKQSITPCDTCSPLSNFSADALEALVNVPNPDLYYQSHFLWDTSDQSSANDNDGVVDAGETIDLAVTIKNYWGQANNVVVTLSAQAQGAVSPDPFITWDIPSVNYGSVGSFGEDDNGLSYDADGVVIGVNQPLRFTVSPDTPNEHVIPILVTVDASNGLDPTDTNTYTTKSRFNLIVQRGRELPSIIGLDTRGTPAGDIDTDGVEDGIVTIDDSALWLIDKPVLVEKGAHLKIGPGAIVQFWGTQPDDTYAVRRDTYIQNEGRISVEGTASAPVTLKVSDLFPNRSVWIKNNPNTTTGDEGLYLSHAVIENPFNMLANEADHLNVYRTVVDQYLAYQFNPSGLGMNPFRNVEILSNEPITKSRFRRMNIEQNGAQEQNGVVSQQRWPNIQFSIEESLIDNTAFQRTNGLPQHKNVVYLNNNQRWGSGYGNYVTQGSLISNVSSDQGKLLVLDTFDWNGSTYARVFFRRLNGISATKQIDAINDFAGTLNGHLMVPSSDEEQTQVRILYSESEQKTDTYAELAALVPECASVETSVCQNVAQNQNYNVVGGVQDENGTWTWITGETPTLSFDPLASNETTRQTLKHMLLSRDHRFGIGATWEYREQLLLEFATPITRQELQTALNGFVDSVVSDTFSNNAVLNQWYDPVPGHWLIFEATTRSDELAFWEVDSSVGGNYWGGASDALVSEALFGYEKDFNRNSMTAQPTLDTAPETAYPFVADLQIAAGDGQPRSDGRFAAEATLWNVTFNRDMDMSIQPMVTFGPDVPYTDFTVNGNWIDARTWQGTLNISPVATDGYQYVRVAGAVAADDPWLISGDDKRRYRFEVITSGVESLNLQASGGEGFVDLSWNQDDYDTLLGFNIYRSTSPDSGFIRINQTLVGNGERSYRDTEVEPGVQYFYNFTVALDGSESEPSNTASATPIDTVKPILSHNIISTAPFGSTVLVQANVTDNIGVQSVTLYYRPIGTTAYTSVEMANISGSNYRASIPASATQPPGVEYYIAATDGASYAYSGRSTSPNTITVENNPVISGVTPSTGSSAGGDTITISGNNFASGASVLLGNATCQNVTVVSTSRITCVTPASAPELVAVTVENPDGGRGVLTSAFTFVGNATSLSLPEFQANQGQTRDIALAIDPVSGLQSFSAVISWDNTHLQLGSVVPGPLVSGWDFSYTLVDDNTVRIQAANSTRVSGSGNLALLEFLVVASGEASSVLDIESAQLNEGTITASLVDGSFSIFPGYSVGGSVRYWNTDQTPIEALLTLNDQQERTSSSVTGAYDFSGLLDQQHTIKIEKSDGIDNSIRAYDASLILSHALGTQLLSGQALASADVTGDGTVSEQDAAKVLEVAAGLATIPFPNQASPWKFDPQERRFDSLTTDVSNADFTGLFMGDVSGNWSGQGIQSSEGFSLEIADMVRQPSGVIVATVNVFAGSELTSDAVSALELSMSTTSGVSLMSVERTPSTASWSNPIIRSQDNVMAFTTYDDVSGALTGEHHVLTLTLSVTNSSQSVLTISGHINEKFVVKNQPVMIRMSDDADGDLVPDSEDAFPNDPAASVDDDGDGAPDAWNENATQEQIDASDLVLDAFLGDPDESLDTDGDGIGNNEDTDDDDDGVADIEDDLPLDASETTDTDGDGLGNNADADDDGDGFSDSEEIAEGTDPLDADSYPDVGGLNLLIIKAAIDASNTIRD